MEKLIEKLVAIDPRLRDEREAVKEIMGSLQKLIRLCGDDPEREGLIETPFRVIKAFMEYTKGYMENPEKHLEKTFTVDYGYVAVHHDEIVLVKDITFHSMCEHHFAPFYGVAHVGYIPNGEITGLSKLARLVEGYAKRFQVQERMTNQIADSIVKVLQPRGVMVVIQAKHMCMCGRGIKKPGSSTITTAARGIFRNAEARKEFLDLIGPLDRPE